MKYVGMDLHKQTSTISILDEDAVVTNKTIRTTRGSLTRVFKDLAPARVLLEASTESEWVARHLEALGLEVVVGAPGYQPMYAFRDPLIKTDRRDAEALMHACAKKQYRASHRCSDARRQLRDRLNVRNTLVGARKQMISTVRARVRAEGLRIASGSMSTFVRRVESLDLSEELRSLLHPLLATIEHLSDQLVGLDQQLTEISREDPDVARLTSVPGVGPVVAGRFVAGLDDPGRFKSASAVANFLGLTAREHSSGGKPRRGRITKRGPGELRRVLVQAAWVIWKGNNPQASRLREWAHRLGERRGRQIAIVALARRLARILWAIWIQQTAYDPKRLIASSKHA